MSALEGRRILLGISGGIAAYKIPSFVRLLRQQGADVRCILTSSAAEFVSPLTLATLSGQASHQDLVIHESGATSWNNHVAHAEWAELIVVAPATTNTIGKLVNGICDNLLMATLMSAKCPIYWAPAMDLDMYAHPANQSNLDKLRDMGHTVWPSPEGELASGLTGPGRMAEPEWMLEALISSLSQTEHWAGKHVVMTSGPTREAIDPVRFLSNGSSGRMGKALAMELARRGACVTFVTGPAEVLPRHERIELVKVTSAQNMLDATTKAVPNAHVVICAAAVSDFRPATASDDKSPKDGLQSLDLVQNPDILATLGKQQRNFTLIGFALETSDAEAKAKAKLERKGADMIVLNYGNRPNQGMHTEDNQITLIDHNGSHPRPHESKGSAARAIIEWIETHAS